MVKYKKKIRLLENILKSNKIKMIRMMKNYLKLYDYIFPINKTPYTKT